MKLTIFSIYDEKAQAFITPFALPQAGMAMRTFADCCNNPEHAFGKHPHDYTLFQIGEFDDETAAITPTKKPLGNGVEFVALELADKQEQLEMTAALDEQEEKTDDVTGTAFPANA
ncbi:nonstructural protein [Microviridae sp.]|nr:nonstructural protein [Microviridae sp.]